MKHPALTDQSLPLVEAVAILKATDLHLARLIDQVGVCELQAGQQSGDLLFCLARTIIHQQLSIRAAATIHCRFLALFPDQVPTARQILQLSPETLRGAGLSRSKVVYIQDLAQKVEAGLPELADIATLSDADVIQTVTQVKGVGRWSAQMLLIFRLNRWDIWPTEDLGIQNALQRLYQLEERPTPQQVGALGKPWAPYRSIAAWYLWRSLDMDRWDR